MNIIIKIDTSCLYADDTEMEVARILADLSDRVQDVGLDIGDKWPLRHDNGTTANARLIAAAPLMLGALKDTIAPLNDLICAAIKHEKWMAEGLATDCLERVEEAIAAAEGRIKVEEL